MATVEKCGKSDLYEENWRERLRKGRVKCGKSCCGVLHNIFYGRRHYPVEESPQGNENEGEGNENPMGHIQLNW